MNTVRSASSVRRDSATKVPVWPPVLTVPGETTVTPRRLKALMQIAQVLTRAALGSLTQSLMVATSLLIPCSRRLVLFGAMNGLLYGDNSRHLFNWVLENRTDLRPVWMTRSKTIYEELRREGKPVALSRSIHGLWLLSRANVGCYTNSLRDLAPTPRLLPSTMKLVALRHGKGVKRVRVALAQHSITEKEAAERMKEARLIAYAISTSEFISDLQEECLKIGREKHVVTGYPRNDCLVAAAERASQRPEWLDETSAERVVLYAPSWRHGREPTRFFPFEDFDPELLCKFLLEHKAVLLLRPHINDLHRYESLRRFLLSLADDCELVQLATHDDFPDVNSILPFVDVLISDYSALYHDFLLLDRPMIFVPYDYEEFERQNGFLYDYFAHLPGPAVDSFVAFRTQLERALTGQDDFATRRHALRDKVHTFRDARSCERVMALVDALLRGDR